MDIDPWGSKNYLGPDPFCEINYLKWTNLINQTHQKTTILTVVREHRSGTFVDVIFFHATKPTNVKKEKWL